MISQLRCADQYANFGFMTFTHIYHAYILNWRFLATKHAKLSQNMKGIFLFPKVIIVIMTCNC